MRLSMKYDLLLAYSHYPVIIYLIKFIIVVQLARLLSATNYYTMYRCYDFYECRRGHIIIRREMFDGTVSLQNALCLLVGRHSTSKPLPQSITGKAADSPVYGHRGEALASIIQLSDSVEVISRSEKSSSAHTYSKTFKEGLGM